MQAATDKQAAEMAAAVEAGAAAPAPAEGEASAKGEEEQVAAPAEGAEDISMEDVLGHEGRKRPAAKTKAEDAAVRQAAEPQVK